MPKKCPKPEITQDVQQEWFIEDVEIKTEKIDIGYNEPMAEVLPAQIYTETDVNWANIEAETGFVSQLDIVKNEIDVDEATIEAFREGMMQFHPCDANEENTNHRSPPRKKRKANAKKKTTTTEKIYVTPTNKENKTVQRASKKGTIEPNTSQSSAIEEEPKPIECVVNGVKMVKCLFCDYQLTRRDRSLVKEHMRVHTGFTPYACRHCPEKFYTRSILLKHIQSDHRTKAIYQCSLCRIYYFTKEDFQAHKFSCVKRRRFECHLCKIQMYTYMYKVKDHMRRLHTGERVYHCQHCDEAFVSMHNLGSHMQHHPEVMEFKCSLCKVRFATEEQRKKHEDICLNKSISQCHLCQYTYPKLTLDSLELHKRKHTGEKPFQCQYCQKFHQIGLVKCDYCNKLFSHIKNKKQHEFQCKKTYECYLCKKKFPSFVILYETHMRTHLGERPYSCAHCDRTFVSIRTYNLHVMTKHLHEYRFQCNACNEIIVVNKDVSKHNRSCLKPTRKAVGIVYFKCSLCGLGLARVPELRSHILQKKCKKIVRRRINTVKRGEAKRK